MVNQRALTHRQKHPQPHNRACRFSGKFFLWRSRPTHPPVAVSFEHGGEMVLHGQECSRFVGTTSGVLDSRKPYAGRHLTISFEEGAARK
jgi:hypothetical protein